MVSILIISLIDVFSSRIENCVADTSKGRFWWRSRNWLSDMSECTHCTQSHMLANLMRMSQNDYWYWRKTWSLYTAPLNIETDKLNSANDTNHGSHVLGFGRFVYGNGSHVSGSAMKRYAHKFAQLKSSFFTKEPYLGRSEAGWFKRIAENLQGLVNLSICKLLLPDACLSISGFQIKSVHRNGPEYDINTTITEQKLVRRKRQEPISLTLSAISTGLGIVKSFEFGRMNEDGSVWDYIQTIPFIGPLAAIIGRLTPKPYPGFIRPQPSVPSAYEGRWNDDDVKSFGKDRSLGLIW